MSTNVTKKHSDLKRIGLTIIVAATLLIFVGIFTG